MISYSGFLLGLASQRLSYNAICLTYSLLLYVIRDRVIPRLTTSEAVVHAGTSSLPHIQRYFQVRLTLTPGNCLEAS